MPTRLILLAIAAVFAAPVAAAAKDVPELANTVGPAVDTYVKRDNKGPFDKSPLLVVKNRGSGKHDGASKTLIRFSMTPMWAAHNPFDARLSLDVAEFEKGDEANFQIYGVRNPNAGPADCNSVFPADVRYKDVGKFLDDSSNGVKERSGCIHGNTLLGTLVVNKKDLKKTVHFSSPALLAYIRENSGWFGSVTFLIVRKETGKSWNTAFASSEHPSLQGPRLSWTDRNDFVFDGPKRPNIYATGPQAFTGNLKLGVRDGGFFTLPEADLEVTFEGGRVATLSGTSALPLLPNGGLMRDATLSGGRVRVGFDTPEKIGRPDLPLESDQQYLYLRDVGVVDVNGKLTLGGQSLPPVIVLDPVQSALFGYMHRLEGTKFPIHDIAVGLSAGDHIPFVPSHKRGVSKQMSTFTEGNLFINGTVPLDTALLESRYASAAVTLSGAMTADANRNDLFANGKDWMRTLGVNGDADISVTLMGSKLPFYLTGASVLYERHSEGRSMPSVTFAADHQEFGSFVKSGMYYVFLPFKGRVHVDGHFDFNDYGLNSYLGIEGMVDLAPGSSVKLDLDGRLEIGPTVAHFNGEVKFVGLKVKVDGTLKPNVLSLGGKTSVNWKYQGNGIEVSLRPTIELTGWTNGKPVAAVSLSKSSAKLCVAGQCSGLKFKKLKVNSNGRVEICVDVAGQSVCAPNL